MAKRTILICILMLTALSCVSLCASDQYSIGTPGIRVDEWGNEIQDEVKQKEYDGVWFLGFNLKKAIFSGDDGRSIRQAFAMAINRPVISKVIGDDTVPGGIIPPGMEGYDPTLKGYPFSLKTAKKMMLSAGYPLGDKRLKNLTILHTDGKKTIDIVDHIKMDLINIGVDMVRTQVSYADTATWRKLLASGKYDLFVMGYKAGSLGELFIGDKDKKIFHTFICYLNPTNEARQVTFDRYIDAVNAGYAPCKICMPVKEKAPSTESLLQPLFYSDGDANFTFYRNKRVDDLLDKLLTVDKERKLTRYEIFNEIDQTVLDDCPVLGLFYITRL